MKSWKWLGLLAALQAAPSWAQESAHSAHQRQKSALDKAQDAAASPSAPGAGYRSAFADYRPFVADEPLKDWRSANDEVRDIGGHMGLTKVDKPNPLAPDAHSVHPQKGGRP